MAYDQKALHNSLYDIMLFSNYHEHKSFLTSTQVFLSSGLFATSKWLESQRMF